MNRTELIEVLAKYGIHPSKAKGQNFLVDQNMLDAMVRSMNLQEGEQVLEVGPGTGVLTRMMLDAGCKLTSVETDKKLFKYLTENIDHPNFTLVYGDACKVNYDDIIDYSKPFRCIANLPYAISSIFIARMTELPSSPTEMYFLLQKEMAERFSAKPHTKKYGSLTVRAGVLYESKIIRKVPPQVFHPPPKIYSSFIYMKLKEEFPEKKTLGILNSVVRAAFSQRRKKAFKLISGSYKNIDLAEGFKAAGISIDDRAEHIEISQYIKLAEFIEENSK
ncbi:MAG: 16S rRNA (adenine(1518)-N(6)/adenine(1519)-N(6))-dimethyltransferase RsmA [Lentisphaeraceae bacterium]|nr:16S rRNA (adenine(1518)-N(6)/adenine(1519)-N(6))-dimethyltransferase RsmA [Lentisphaeraceae bacterium]